MIINIGPDIDELRHRYLAEGLSHLYEKSPKLKKARTLGHLSKHSVPEHWKDQVETFYDDIMTASTVPECLALLRKWQEKTWEE